MWEEEVGPLGERPQIYWNVILSYGSGGLTPNDLEELTLYQLFSAVVSTRDAFEGG